MMGNSKHHGQPCAYCQRIMARGHPKLAPTKDHFIPQWLEGRIIVISCAQCNTIKADMTPVEWESFMATHPGWWILTKAQLRQLRRAPREATPLSEAELIAKYRGRRLIELRQKPVVVPPDLIFRKPTEDPPEQSA